VVVSAVRSYAHIQLEGTESSHVHIGDTGKKLRVEFTQEAIMTQKKEAEALSGEIDASSAGCKIAKGCKSQGVKCTWSTPELWING
jgi:hypothetical protein